MRKLSFILTIAMLIIAVIIIPVGISNVYLALQLGLVFECVSSIFFLCLFIAFCLFEVREFIRDYCKRKLQQQANCVNTPVRRLWQY